MSKYQILPYSYEQAQKYNVVILPSSNPKKKIDVYKKVDPPPLKYSDTKKKNPKVIVGSKKIASIGAYGYPDYPTYMKIEGKEYADERRRLYKIRHQKTRTKKDSASYWVSKLLW